MKLNIRLLYLYLFAFIGLLVVIIGSVQIVDLALKTYVFKVSEYSYYSDPTLTTPEMEKRNLQDQADQRKRQVSNSLAMILVGAPVYLYHWGTIKKENKR